MRRYVFLAAVLSIACSPEKPLARPDPAPIASQSSPPPAPSPSPSISAAPDAGLANDGSAAAAPRPLRCIDGQMVEDRSEEMGLGAAVGVAPDPGPLMPGAKPKDSGLGGLGQGNVRGTIASTKELTNDEANAALCPAMKKVRACVLALADSRKGGVRSDEELEVTVVSGAVKSVKSTSAPLPPELAAILDKEALKCSIDGLKSAAFSSGSGVVRYRVEIDVSGSSGSSDAKGVKIVELSPKIPKGLSPDVVRKAVRTKAFARFRHCYETGLKSNATLAGVVSVSFTIDTDGAVASASLDEKASTIPDAAMKACVLGVYRTLSFPKPEGVPSMTVVYPIDFRQ